MRGEFCWIRGAHTPEVHYLCLYVCFISKYISLTKSNNLFFSNNFQRVSYDFNNLAGHQGLLTTKQLLLTILTVYNVFKKRTKNTNHPWTCHSDVTVLSWPVEERNKVEYLPLIHKLHTCSPLSIFAVCYCYFYWSKWCKFFFPDWSWLGLKSLNLNWKMWAFTKQDDAPGVCVARLALCYHLTEQHPFRPAG